MKPMAFIVLGLLLAGIGTMYMVFDKMISDYIIPRFWVSTSEMEVMLIEWHAIPVILFLLSLFCFILAGMGTGGQQVVIQQ